MVPYTMLFCSPGISFEGKNRFKSALTSVTVYLEQPKHNSVASSLIQFSLGVILVFLHMPTRLWGAGFLLTSFSPLQSGHGDLGHHLTPLYNQQAKTGTSRHKLTPWRRDGSYGPPELPPFPSYCRALANIYKNSTRPMLKTGTAPGSSWRKNTSMNFDWSFCGQLIKGCKSPWIVLGVLKTQTHTSLTRATTPPYACFPQK